MVGNTPAALMPPAYRTSWPPGSFTSAIEGKAMSRAVNLMGFCWASKRTGMSSGEAKTRVHCAVAGW
jgi:hypothetical protein